MGSGIGDMVGNIKGIKSLFNPNVMDPSQAPWGDLDAGEKSSRVIGGAAKGLGQGMQNYQQQNSAMRNPGGGQMPAAAAPDPQAPQFGTGNLPGGGAPGMGNPMMGAVKRNQMFYGQ